jgi:hypothetical protein
MYINLVQNEFFQWSMLQLDFSMARCTLQEIVLYWGTKFCSRFCGHSLVFIRGVRKWFEKVEPRKSENWNYSLKSRNSKIEIRNSIQQVETRKSDVKKHTKVETRKLKVGIPHTSGVHVNSQLADVERCSHRSATYLNKLSRRVKCKTL